MNLLIDNWYLIVGMVAVLAVVIYGVVLYLNLPTSKQIENLKEWLKFAVTEAEKELGSGTGQLKLRMVYNLAVERFPELIKVIDFSTFSAWVDESLIWLNNQLEQNKNFERIVKES